MDMIDAVSKLTGVAKTVLMGPPALFTSQQDLGKALRITSWNVPGKVQPSEDALAAALAEPAPLSLFASAVQAAAAQTCDLLVAAVAPNDARRLAYQSAYSLVVGAGGVPTADLAKGTFSRMAASLGFTDLSAFAALVESVALISMEIGTTQSTLSGACSAAATTADLAAALAAFESSVADIVAQLNTSGITVAVSAPPAILIAGVNG